MKSKKNVIALIVAFIAIALFFFAHHYGWGAVYETFLLCISFLAASYLLFFDSFIKEFGKEAAQTLFAEQKTTIEEQIRLGFSKAISDYQAENDKSNKFFEINYSKFQEKRFDVIVELYSKLAVLSMDASHLTDRMDLGRDEEVVVRERVNAFKNDYSEFIRFLKLNKLFIEEESFLKLMNKSNEINGLCFNYSQYVCMLRHLPQGNKEKEEEIMEKLGSIFLSLPIQLTEIENEMKRMLYPKDYFAYAIEKEDAKSTEVNAEQDVVIDNEI